MKRSETKQTLATTLATPIGNLHIAATPRGLCRIDFRGKAARRMRPGDAAAVAARTRQARRHLDAAVHQLQEYFAGRRTAFTVHLDLEGTRHQQCVWRALQGIPFGRALSYGELARRLGVPRGARGVGHACARNPVPVVVPCHRVVGGDGTLRGYDGGLWRKRFLLKLESHRSR